MENFVGVWWAGHDADLKLVGEDGKGYKSISWSFPNLDAPLMKEIKEHVIDAGLSQTNEEEMQGVFYGRGLVMSAILAEGIKNAQENFGTAAIDAAARAELAELLRQTFAPAQSAVSSRARADRASGLRQSALG